jgi:2,4-dienoyl-CoA reductase (NADPH2)
VKEYLKQMRDLFLEFGFPRSSADEGKQMLEAFQNAIPFPEKYLLLDESAGLLEKLGISYMSCPVHSQTDIVYLAEDFAITGDVILREIFTVPLLDIDADSFDGRFKNYAAYCDTISKLKSIEERDILPSHKDYIDSIDERIFFYVNKIAGRAERVASLLKSGKSIYETVMSLPGVGNRDYYRTYIKTCEIVFISDFLKQPELLVEALKKNGLYGRVKDKMESLMEG